MTLYTCFNFHTSLRTAKHHHQDIRITSISCFSSLVRFPSLLAPSRIVKDFNFDSPLRLLESKSTVMSYKVEELLALRDSVSESAVSIDKFADEDVIKGQGQT